jgi:nucleotidyltransferase substrate binding protein (TIGR01987 family)
MNTFPASEPPKRLDVSALERALASLGRALVRARAAPADEEVRDAVIQRFEYSYELCWKMLKRQLEIEAPVPAAIDAMSFKEMLREAAEKGWLEFEPWLVFREQRNITSHAYNADKAASVYRTAVEFHPVACGLLGRLKERNA